MWQRLTPDHSSAGSRNHISRNKRPMTEIGVTFGIYRFP